MAGGFVAAAFSEATGFSARCVAEEGCFFASASVVQERKLIVRYNKTICKTNEGMHSMYSRSATFPEERSDMAFAGSALALALAFLALDGLAEEKMFIMTICCCVVLSTEADC